MENKITDSIKILFCIFFWNIITRVIIINSISFHSNATERESVSKDKLKKKTKWSLTHLVSLGPTYSCFLSNIKKEQDKYDFSKTLEKSENFDFGKGLYFLHEFQCGYKVLEWLENQIFINLAANFLVNNPHHDPQIKFTGSADINFGINIIGYQNTFFQIMGFGLKVSFPFNYERYFQISPILKLGFGYKFNFGLILRFVTNLSPQMIGLQNMYNEILEEISKGTLNRKNIAKFGSSISFNILEFSIGFDYEVLLNKI